MLGRTKKKEQPVGRRRPGQSGPGSDRSGRSDLSDLSEGRKKPSVFSYYSSGERDQADDQPTRKQPRQPLTRRQKLAILYGSIVAGLLLLFFCTTLSTNPAVSFAGQTASPYRTTDEYQQHAAALLAQHLGSQSKFTINTGPVEQQLVKDFPELSAAHISLPVVGRRPSVVLVLRRPALILTTDNNAFVLDHTGMVVSDLAHTNADVRKDLPTVEDSNKLPLEVGKQAITTDTVAFIQGALAQLAAKEITVDRLSLPAVANELDIHLKDLKYYLKSDVTGVARIQIGSFLAVKDSGVTPAEYMDLRVEEKVFYK